MSFTTGTLVEPLTGRRLDAAAMRSAVLARVGSYRDAGVRPGDRVFIGSAPLLKLRAIAGVWVFFGLLHIWVVGGPNLSLAQRGAFFLSLFGL